MTKNKRFVAYYRVSTARQGESGLGLESQQRDVMAFVKSTAGEVMKEFVEVESGKRSDRPILNEALKECRENGYTLLVAKLDRLSRNLHFVTALQESKVEFVAVDNPNANSFLIHILVSVAEYERKMISERTKKALQSAKDRGTRLGNPRPDISKMVKVKRESAAVRNRSLRRTVDEIMEKTGLTRVTDIARSLNLRGIRTVTGKTFTSTQVRYILETT